MLNNTKGESTRLGRTFRAHPVAIALIGVECGWLAISATGARERLRKQASDASTHARAWTGQLRDKLMAARSSTSRGPDPAEAGGHAYAREKSDQAMAQPGSDASSASASLRALAPAGQAISAAGHRTTDAARSINERLSDVRERFGEVLESHPLMILGLTVAAGAAISLALPASEKKQDGGDRIEGAKAAEMLK